nr:hypothetical protein [Tanacetum cinerariifolium]
DLCFFWISSGPLILLETCGIANLALQGSSGSGKKYGRNRVLYIGREKGVGGTMVQIVRDI